MYANFHLEMPERLEQAVALLAQNNGEKVLPLAGGTNLIVDIRGRRVMPDQLISLSRIPGLRWIRNSGGRLAIGGATTVSDLLHSPEIARHGAPLVDSARVFGGQMVRNAATIAGNIASGSPAADLVPPLLALDADVVLTGASGQRTVSLSRYFTGYKTDVRNPHELITEISWPLPAQRSVNRFYKLGRRKGDAIAVTGVAVMLAVANGVCHEARIALGAVAPIVIRARSAEGLIEGKALTSALIDEAGRVAAEECRPIDDIRASADYRRHTVHVLVRRLLVEAWLRLA